MMSLFDQLTSQNEKINHPEIKKYGVELWIKREDLLHDSFGGNKIRKLKYHLKEYSTGGFKGIITFGGAWSNHIYASASLFNQLRIPSIGIIRGEQPNNYSDTLIFAEKNGMKLKFISRSEYRRRNEKEFIEELKIAFPNYYVIPEGGSGIKGMQGCEEILQKEDQKFDLIACSCGTGATLAGICNSIHSKQSCLGFSALKNGEFLVQEVHKLLMNDQASFTINTDFHFGGYAKTNSELIEFMRDFYNLTGIKLDPVYTGKMMFGITELIRTGAIQSGKKVLCIHTGGLQGISGIEKKLKEKIY